MLKKLFLNDRFIITLIILNAITIFFQGFHLPVLTYLFLFHADNIITILFILELSTKMHVYGVKEFLRDRWNLFDTVLVLLAVPGLLLWVIDVDILQLDFLLVLRIMRIFKFYKILFLK
jgi:voltage-gated sodium channel